MMMHQQHAIHTSPPCVLYGLVILRESLFCRVLVRSQITFGTRFFGGDELMNLGKIFGKIISLFLEELMEVG